MSEERVRFQMRISPETDAKIKAAMPRVIFKCPHIKGGTARAAAHPGNAVGYIAARKGVQRIDPGKTNLPATENQINMVEKLAREFPLSKGLEEYADYQESPARGNASDRQDGKLCGLHRQTSSRAAVWCSRAVQWQR